MNFIWTTFPILEAIPSNGVCFARCSDNVLDVEDWNVYKLTFSHGIIIAVEVLNYGVYVDISNDFLGMSRYLLQQWCESDEHYCHPASYYEIATGLIGGTPDIPRTKNDDIPF